MTKKAIYRHKTSGDLFAIETDDQIVLKIFGKVLKYGNLGDGGVDGCGLFGGVC